MKKTLFALSLAATAVAGAAVAQGGLPRGDANRDGVVTRAEATVQADARFARLDANRDGSVTGNERRAARQARRAERQARVVTAAQFQARAQARFARLDANHDGTLTGEERRMRARHGRHHGAGMGMRGPGRGMEQGAERADRTVTAATFRERALSRFDRADANRDGRLDQAELAARHGRMRAPRPPVAG